MKALKPCLDCGFPSHTGLCGSCKSQRQSKRDDERGTAYQRGYDSNYLKNRSRLMEQEHCCELCGSTDELQADHIIPLAAGGTNDLSNLRVLCRACNTTKSAHDKRQIAAFRQNKETRAF